MPKPLEQQGDAPSADAVARWIRARRSHLRLTVSQVASALGVTPAFISMIETGKKRPGVEVAAKLAKQLQDEEGLLLKWISMYRPKSLERARATALEIEEFLSRQGPKAQGTREVGATPSTTAQPRSLQALEAMAPTSAWQAPTIEQIPVLEEGADPDEAAAAPVRHLLIDLGLLPSETTLVRPFAYRLSIDGAARARDLLRAEDVVVMTRDCWPTTKDGVYAVRLEHGIVLSRVQVRGNMLLLVSADLDTAGFEVLQFEGQDAPKALVARVVMGVRTWR